MQQNRAAHIFLSLALVGAMAVFVYNPSQYILSFTSGLSIFAYSVLPSLFPFMIFVAMSIRLNWPQRIGNFLAKPTKKLMNCSAYGGYVFFMSIISGYPIGAKLTAELYELGKIGQSEAEKITAFTSTTGPVFVLGTLAAMIFKDTRIGVIVLVAHIFATVLTGFTFCNLKRKKVAFCNDLTIKDNNYSTKKGDISSVITDNVFAILVVGAYIALFNTLGEMLSPILGHIALLASKIGIDYSICFSFIYSFIEMTKGAVLLAQSSADFVLKVVITAFSVSLGGFSILMQSLTFLTKAKIKPLYFISVKLVQGLFAAVIAYLICVIFI